MRSQTKDEILPKSKSYDEITSHHLRLVRLLGILPLKGRDYNFPVTRFLVGCFFSSCVTHFYMFIVHGYHLVKLGIIEIEYICEFVMVIGHISRYSITITKRHEFRDLHADCRAIWDSCTQSERRTAYSFVRKIQTFFNWFFIVVFITNIFYLFSAYSIRLPPIRPNGTETRALPLKYSIEGIESPTRYTVLYTLQFFVLQTALMMVLGVDTSAAFIIMFCCGFFRILQDRLLLIQDKRKLISNEESDIDVYKEIVACSMFHQKILKLCDKIQKFATAVFFVQVLCTGYNMSLVGIKLAGSDPDRYKYSSILVLCFVQLFITQWSPDFLLEESEGVTTAAYFASLAGMDPKTGRLLLIIMQRARRSVEITAGGVIKMSIETFGSMMTNAFSFFTVLRSFNV